MFDDDRVQAISRAASLAIAVAYVVAAHFARGGEAAFRMTCFLLLPLTCIWFSDAMGRFTGGGWATFRRPITQPTPGCFVAFGGWLLLLLPLVALLIA